VKVFCVAHLVPVRAVVLADTDDLHAT